MLFCVTKIEKTLFKTNRVVACESNLVSVSVTRQNKNCETVKVSIISIILHEIYNTVNSTIHNNTRVRNLSPTLIIWLALLFLLHPFSLSMFLYRLSQNYSKVLVSTHTLTCQYSLQSLFTLPLVLDLS